MVVPKVVTGLVTDKLAEIYGYPLHTPNTGVSMVLAPNGAVMEDLRDENGSPFVRGYMYAEVPITNTGLTIYAMFGDWAVAICFFIVIAHILMKRMMKKFDYRALMPK